MARLGANSAARIYDLATWIESRLFTLLFFCKESSIPFGPQI
jgi:hypothetical protein